MTFKRYGHIHPEFTHKKVEKLLKKYGFSVERKQYSENIFYQLCLFSIIFLPKIILELIFGTNKANEYTNRNIFMARDGQINSRKNHPLLQEGDFYLVVRS
jgi:outer membrane protein W